MLELMHISDFPDVAIKTVEAAKPGMPVFSQRIWIVYRVGAPLLTWVAWTFDSPHRDQVLARMGITWDMVETCQWYP